MPSVHQQAWWACHLPAQLPVLLPRHILTRGSATCMHPPSCLPPLAPLLSLPTPWCRMYHAIEPPSYDLGAIDSPPLAIFYGGRDKLADAEDVATLLQALPQGTVVYQQVGLREGTAGWACLLARWRVGRIVVQLHVLTHSGHCCCASRGGGGGWHRQTRCRWG